MTSAPDSTVLGLIAEIEDQEGALVFTRFDNADAWRLGCLLVDMARERALAEREITQRLSAHVAA